MPGKYLLRRHVSWLHSYPQVVLLTPKLDADIVVAPNPTGSTGYGQSFTDAIKESWGGLPYQDILNGFAYIKESMEYVDTNRAVALGASYGGYMMNWMQGHSLGKEFKGMLSL